MPMPMPEVGKKAPEFSVADETGKARTLKEFRGQHVVLYFYPKDDTPGCTVEACNFRDDYGQLTKAGAVVLGVSPDDSKRHVKFIEKFSLPFPLLADTDHKVAEAYCAWGEKSMYGRKFMGIVRSTVLIDPEGKVKQVWPKVSVKEHSQEILAALHGGPMVLPVRKAPAKVARAAPAKSAAKAPGKSAPKSAAKAPAKRATK